jgi:hypothetical protein
MHHKGHQPSASEASDAHQAEMQKMIADMMPSPSDPSRVLGVLERDLGHGHRALVVRDHVRAEIHVRVAGVGQKEIAEIQAWLKQNGK